MTQRPSVSPVAASSDPLSSLSPLLAAVVVGLESSESVSSAPPAFSLATVVLVSAASVVVAARAASRSSLYPSQI
ncbi:MAG: hypothetical protein ACPHJ1_09455 [Ilumatobacteraceae bacterium]